MFIDRHQELAALEQMFQSGVAEFFVLYGRRRVGKTELLTQFCKGKRSIYFLASQFTIKRLIGIYTTPHELIVYRDGNKIQLVALCFEVEVVGGELRLSCETTEYGYFSYQEIQELDILLNHARRIEDAYSGKTTTFIR